MSPCDGPLQTKTPCRNEPAGGELVYIGCVLFGRSPSSLFRDPLLEKPLDDKAGRKTCQHSQSIGLDIRPTDKLAQQVLDDIHRFQPVGKIGYPPSHMLFVDIILMLQVADGFPQFIYGPYLIQLALF
jgi:hypothetical protein